MHIYTRAGMCSIFMHFHHSLQSFKRFFCRILSSTKDIHWWYCWTGWLGVAGLPDQPVFSHLYACNLRRGFSNMIEPQKFMISHHPKWKMLEIIWYQIRQRIAWKKNLLRIPSTGSNSQPFLWLRRWLSKCSLCSPCNCTGFGHRSHWQQRCAGSLWPQSWNEANHLQTFLQWCLSMVCFGFAPSTWACWLCLSLVFQQKWLLPIAVHCFPKVALLISGEALAYASAGWIFTTFPQFSQAVSVRYEPWAAWRQDDGSTQNLFSSYILIISTFWGRFLEGFHITVLSTFRISIGSSLTPRIHVPISPQLQRFGLTLAPTGELTLRWRGRQIWGGSQKWNLDSTCPGSKVVLNQKHICIAAESFRNWRMITARTAYKQTNESIW